MVDNTSDFGHSLEGSLFHSHEFHSDGSNRSEKPRSAKRWLTWVEWHALPSHRESNKPPRARARVIPQGEIRVPQLKKGT